MPLNAAYDIFQAMNRVKLSITNREEFLQSCVLHSLITEQNVDDILGEKSMTLPRSKAHKTELLQQYQAGSQQAAALIARLEDLDGNAAAYAESLSEVRFLSDDLTVLDTDTFLTDTT